MATSLTNLASLLKATNRPVEAELLYRRTALILLRSSKANGHLLPDTAPALRSYASILAETGHRWDNARAFVSTLITEAGVDPAELWPQVFGEDG